ncbi:hypothetical protein MMPV_001500 [Pyropia vietnamensis]
MALALPPRAAGMAGDDADAATRAALTAAAAADVVLELEATVGRSPTSPTAWVTYADHLATAPAATRPPAADLWRVYERGLAALPYSYKLWHAYARGRAAAAVGRHPHHAAHAAAERVARRAVAALPSCPVLWEELLELLAARAHWTAARRVVDAALLALPLPQHPRLWGVVAAVWARPGAPPAVRRRLAQRRAALLGTVTTGLLDDLRDAAVGEGGLPAARRYARVLAAAAGVAIIGREGRGRRRGALSAAAPATAPIVDASVAGGGSREERADAAALAAARASSRTDAWRALVELGVDRPAAVDGIVDVAALLREAVGSPPAGASVGSLWVSLAAVVTRRVSPRAAVGVYEEALASVTTARDFAVVYDGYAALVEAAAVAAVDAGAPDGVVDRRLAVAEALASRRRVAAAEVALRGHPTDVSAWAEAAAARLAVGDTPGAVAVYTRAVARVRGGEAVGGRVASLWRAFAGLYVDVGDVASARAVYARALGQSLAADIGTPGEVAALYAAAVEVELRAGRLDAVRALLRRATTDGGDFARNGDDSDSRRSSRDSESDGGGGGGGGDPPLGSPAVVKIVRRSPLVAALAADVAAAVLPPRAVAALHTTSIARGTASAATVLSGAATLSAAGRYEDAYRLLDAGASALRWPAAAAVWITLGSSFVKRYGGARREQARDIFESALAAAPPAPPRPPPQGSAAAAAAADTAAATRALYLLYADFEERHGTPRAAVAVYTRAAAAAAAASSADAPALYRLAVVRTAAHYGAVATRPLLGAAVEALRATSPSAAAALAAGWAALEARAGETTRARSLYATAAAAVPPPPSGAGGVMAAGGSAGGGVGGGVWAAWHAFELGHGDEVTFREMLRARRVAALRHGGGLVVAVGGRRGVGGSAGGVAAEAVVVPPPPEADATATAGAAVAVGVADGGAVGGGSVGVVGSDGARVAPTFVSAGTTGGEPPPPPPPPPADVPAAMDVGNAEEILLELDSDTEREVGTAADDGDSDGGGGGGPPVMPRPPPPPPPDGEDEPLPVPRPLPPALVAMASGVGAKRALAPPPSPPPDDGGGGDAGGGGGGGDDRGGSEEEEEDAGDAGVVPGGWRPAPPQTAARVGVVWGGGGGRGCDANWVGGREDSVHVGQVWGKPAWARLASALRITHRRI